MSSTPPPSSPAPSPKLQFAANLSWLYPELPFLDRFETAARDGFTGVECLFPDEHPLTEVQARLRDLDLPLVLFNARPGNWARGERGLACLDGREADFRASIHGALELAQTLACPRVHVMAGLPSAAKQAVGAPTPDTVRELARAWDTYEARLRWAAEQAQAAQVTLMIEPINPRDMPGYLLSHQHHAHALVQRIGSRHLKVQMDLYHAQIVEGDVTMQLRQWLPTGQVGHLQLAAVPDRGEPDSGELHYPWLFEQLRALGWSGWIGCEYRPRRDGPGGTSAGLSWLRAAQQAH